MTAPLSSPATRLGKLVAAAADRLPLSTQIRRGVVDHPLPNSLERWGKLVGSLAAFLLVVMIATGVILAMHYTPHVDHAFDSVERIMRDVGSGWLVRYLHKNGASLFFAVAYIHVFRCLYLRSYRPPRERMWRLGVILLLLMTATAFMGYVLPWGQMSLWGATVITSAFSAVPVVGERIVAFLWGGYAIGTPTLNRFFVLHFLLPFAIFGVTVAYLGRRRLTKDLFALGIFLVAACVLVFWFPDHLGHPDNYVPADPAVTPPHLMPEWYFLPLYAVLRAIPDKLMGVVAMVGALLVLFAVPRLDRSPEHGGRPRPWFAVAFWLFALDCILLGYIGAKPAEGVWMVAARLATAYYFLHFLVVLPLLTHREPDARGRLPGLAATGLKALTALAAVLAVASPFGGETLREHDWSWRGPFGGYDAAQLRRGHQVYSQSCAACHGMKRVRFRELAALGYGDEEIAAFAAARFVTDGPDDEGEMFERPGLPSDAFPSPFPNDRAAMAANSGAKPPDLSLLAKASVGGADYVVAVLTGYGEPPPATEIPPGTYYNTAFPGHAIAMAPQIFDGAFEFADGAPNDAAAIARDVAAFLQWASEPELEARRAMGLRVAAFLLALLAAMYALKRRDRAVAMPKRRVKT